MLQILDTFSKLNLCTSKGMVTQDCFMFLFYSKWIIKTKRGRCISLNIYREDIFYKHWCHFCSHAQNHWCMWLAEALSTWSNPSLTDEFQQVSKLVFPLNLNNCPYILIFPGFQDEIWHICEATVSWSTQIFSHFCFDHFLPTMNIA